MSRVSLGQLVLMALMVILDYRVQSVSQAARDYLETQYVCVLDRLLDCTYIQRYVVQYILYIDKYVFMTIYWDEPKCLHMHSGWL